MRTVIQFPSSPCIQKLVEQQFDIAKQILAKGLVPIIEPEVDINSPEKMACEYLLKSALLLQLDNLNSEQKVILKLTLPDSPNFYQECINHENIIRVVALSGGYSQELANNKLSYNQGMVASFSRALTEGLTVKQSEHDFSETLKNSIASIFIASTN